MYNILVRREFFFVQGDRLLRSESSRKHSISQNKIIFTSYIINSRSSRVNNEINIKFYYATIKHSNQLILLILKCLYILYIKFNLICYGYK